MTLVVRRQARIDADQQYQYLEQNSGRDVAEWFTECVGRTYEGLERNPTSGTLYGFLATQWQDVRYRRVESFPNHLVFYRELPDGADVLRLLHAARNVDGIFS